ncbi:putative Protein kinase domain containing protein [Blattamonas nauphoetae]|uniref:Protein kinase domain-containing protein n=1 Tax=Blattamonas nauphoetae TaxID=2049346 RepID=A0ABQ9Y660_9EUKA|nr:putative Protein kinase domain containing protein [Blattamonas nauphoetae]
MATKPMSTSIDPTKYTSHKPFSSSRSSCLEYCLDQQGSSVTFRRAERLSSQNKQLYDEELTTVQALENADGMKVAAQYTSWDNSRPDAVYGILEVDPATNLKLQMNQWKNEQKQWTDDDLLLLVVQLMYPLRYMHTKFIHRYIKPASIFLETAKPALYANFQFALKYNQESGNKTTAPYIRTDYIQPRETIVDRPSYDSRVDIWAVGLILHEIAYGESIFGTANDFQKTKKIFDNKFEIKQYDPHHPKFHAILLKMLSTDSDVRPTAASLLQDPKLQPALNFLTSIPAVPMIKTNATSILNSAIPQESFPENLATRQSLFVQSMGRLQVAGSTTISVDSTRLTESACDAFFSLPTSDIKKSLDIQYKSGTTSSSVDFKKFLRDIFAELGNKDKIGILEFKNGVYSLSSDPQKQRPQFIRYYRLLGILVGYCLIRNLKLPIRFDQFIWRQLAGYSLDPRELKFVNEQRYNEIQSLSVNVGGEVRRQKFCVDLPDGTSHPLFIGGSFKTLDEDLLPAYKEQAMVAILNYYTPFVSLARTHLQSLVSESDLRRLSALELSQYACD